ncbi:MAG: hypothetical protein JKY67_02935 [Pseudomonadales bacterium]|nr:hypothetical protein [Pseudomonadales bacterium]
MKIGIAIRCSHLGLLLTIALSVFPQISSARNSFLVAPGRVDFDLTRPKTESFIITNNGDGKIRLSIKPTYFAIDSKALALGTSLRPETAEIENLTGFIRVSPRTLSLQPGQKRNIRISLRPPKGLLEGDYRTHLLVSMLEAAQVVKTSNDNPDMLGMELSIKMETGVAIFGHKGERSPILDVACTTDPETNALAFIINNTSIWRFDGMIEVFPSTGSTETPLLTEHIVSYRESRNESSTSWVPTSSGPFFIRWMIADNKEIVGSKTCRIE